MLKLKELHIKNVGRFVDSQTIDFSSMGSLVQVDGKNNNTGGSSGAGKSTIFNALDYLLGLNDIPNTVLQSRLTKETMDVMGVFDLDGKTLKIQRNKKLSVDLDGEVVTGSSKLAEEKLDEILGMPRKLFRPILHKRQKEGGFFLQFTPKEVHGFLTDSLGLSNLKEKAETVDAKIKELNSKKDELNIKLTSIESALEATNSSISSMGEAPIQEVTEDILNKYLQNLAIWKNTLEETKEKHKKDLVALDQIRQRHTLEKQQLDLSRPSPAASVFDSSKKGALENQLLQLQSKEKELKEKEFQRQSEVKNQIHELTLLKNNLNHDISKGESSALSARSIALEVKKIRDSLCPTCEQTWITEQAKEKEKQLLAKLLELKEDIEKGKEAESKILKINSKVEGLLMCSGPMPILELDDIDIKINEIKNEIATEKQKESDHTEQENKRIKLLFDEFNAKQIELEKKHKEEILLNDPAQRHREELENVLGNLDIHRRTYEIGLEKFNSSKEAIKRYRATLDLLNNQIKDLQKNKESLLFDLNKIEKELILAEEAKKALKSYASCSFDDALEYIGDTATNIIRGIPNMANATIQLEGTKETKDGKIKEEVNAVINMDGEIAIPIKSLSGGERSSVDLAVDLAVVDFLENRTGNGIDVFILDEPFTGLDSVSIEMALELLKNSNLSKKIIMVDHNPVIKEFVNDRIVVVRNGDTSNIER